MRDYINKRKRISEAEAQYIMRNLAMGLKSLFDHRIIHRDLKPENLLWSDKTERHTLKIADLGLSKNVD